MTDPTSADIERIRAEIEGLDGDIVALVAKRLHLCLELTPLKMAAGLEAHIPHRVPMVIERWANHAIGHGIDPEPIRSICAQIIAEGERLQSEAMAQARVVSQS